MSSSCTVFSSESKLASHGADHQVHASPHAPSVKTIAASDSSPGYVASPSRVAPPGRSTISSSLLFLSPPSPFLVSPGRSRSCRRRKRPLASLRQRGNDGGKAVASGSGIAVASGRGLVRLRFLCNLFVGRFFFSSFMSQLHADWTDRPFFRISGLFRISTQCLTSSLVDTSHWSGRGNQTLLRNSPKRPKSQQHHLDTVRCKTGVSLHTNTEMPCGCSDQFLPTNLPYST